MIGILDTGVSNISSVLFAVERLGFAAKTSNDPDFLSKCSHIIFPGVGSAQALFKRLSDLKLTEFLRELKQPVLGICLGMQALYEFSEEGQTECLGLVAGSVRRFQGGPALTVPHMGWNRVFRRESSLLLKDVPEGSHFYFVHSYAAGISAETTGMAQYGGDFSAIVEKGNFFGTQFHPEKSGKTGEKIIRNFLEI